jgi:hypothetical protein
MFDKACTLPLFIRNYWDSGLGGRRFSSDVVVICMYAMHIPFFIIGRVFTSIISLDIHYRNSYIYHYI